MLGCQAQIQNAEGKQHMTTPRLRSIHQLWSLLDDYSDEVNESHLSVSSKKDYILFAEMFVRWVDNDFTPGVHAARLYEQLWEQTKANGTIVPLGRRGRQDAADATL